MDFAGLVDGVLAGDRASEELLAARFLPRVRAFLRVRTRSAELVEDASQETLMAVVSALRAGRLREKDKLSSFVFGIARNQLAELIRRQTRVREEPFAAGFDSAAQDNPYEELMAREAKRELDLLESLDRRILVMSLVEGYRAHEIAAALALSEENVRQRKSRVLKKITQKLVRAQSTSVTKTGFPSTID